MKYLKLLFVFFVLSFSQNSCTKCLKCTEKSKDDVLIVDYPETCGNWRDLAKYEERVRAQALKESNVVCTPKSKIPMADSY
jgi:hypothetical protein